jgi:hypothetical protein
MQVRQMVRLRPLLRSLVLTHDTYRHGAQRGVAGGGVGVAHGAVFFAVGAVAAMGGGRFRSRPSGRAPTPVGARASRWRRSDWSGRRLLRCPARSRRLPKHGVRCAPVERHRQSRWHMDRSGRPSRDISQVLGRSDRALSFTPHWSGVICVGRRDRTASAVFLSVSKPLKRFAVSCSG